MAIIEAYDLMKHYDDGAIKALDGVDLSIEEGEFVAIIGPSGSGKSTLLHMLGALDSPTSGRILIDGVDLAAERDLAGFRRRTVGFVFQLHNLIPTLTAEENVEIPLVESRLKRLERRSRAKELLSRVGLGKRLDNLPTKLSGGERQRVAIARALVNGPRILIADEPTGAVDSENSVRIMELLKEINRSTGMTLLVVTHDPEVAERADRIIRMLDGHVVEREAAA
ncbi:MAG: ABC transporter ATP-binding protein [Coriobacteriia bacterium]|nr:ABC transporter ATP-binding protein [Coriobacteriia bacterium]